MAGAAALLISEHLKEETTPLTILLQEKCIYFNMQVGETVFEPAWWFPVSTNKQKPFLFDFIQMQRGRIAARRQKKSNRWKLWINPPSKQENFSDKAGIRESFSEAGQTFLHDNKPELFLKQIQIKMCGNIHFYVLERMIWSSYQPLLEWWGMQKNEPIMPCQLLYCRRRINVYFSDTFHCKHTAASPGIRRLISPIRD